MVKISVHYLAVGFIYLAIPYTRIFYIFKKYHILLYNVPMTSNKHGFHFFDMEIKAKRGVLL